MNEFLKKLVGFAIVLLVYFGLNFGANIVLENRSLKNLKIENSLALGDSHMARAIDPDAYGGITNVAQNSEPLFITYYKLKKICNEHPVDTVLLSLSFNNLSNYNEQKLSDPQWSNEMFKRYLTLYSPLIKDSVVKDTKLYFDTLLKEMCLIPNRTANSYIGSYKNSSISKLDKTDEVVKRHFSRNDVPTQISRVEIDYLDSIINFSSQHKITLYVVATPLHRTYKNRVPKLFNKTFEELKANLKLRGIQFLDHRDFDLNDSLFFNADHLNKNGATIFSKELARQIKVN